MWPGPHSLWRRTQDSDPASVAFARRLTGGRAPGSRGPGATGSGGPAGSGAAPRFTVEPSLGKASYM